MSTKGFFRTSDEAVIYYEVDGEGQPLLLVHGWSCSSKFFQRNVPVLKKHFKVVTLDLRGHGQSSKGLHGYVLSRLAQDIRELIIELKLENVILMGWSLGGPTPLSYWQQFKSNSKLAGLGLIDMTAFPFSDGEWNSHSLRNHNAEGFNVMVNNLLNHREAFFNAFINGMFYHATQPTGTEWVNDECLKLPPYIGIALYSDYIYSDFTNVLPTITIPTVVFSANSKIFVESIKQGQYMAAQIPNGECVPFYQSGHMLFYEEAEKFNNTVIEFAKKCQK